ncbi:MAG TPA: RsmB/NOP family class I SAM-dependent RNA methyltransferase [Alphaproteobacteria bacterium]
MTPSARIQAAIELWDKIWSAGIPMDSMTGDYFRVRRYIGSSDRREIAARVYSMMRSYARVTWWLQKAHAVDTPRTRVIADLSLREEKPKVFVTDLFPGGQHSAEKLDEMELRALDTFVGQKLDHPDMPIEARVECPPEAAQKLHDIFGDRFAEEMAAMIDPAPLDLRVNTIKTDVEGATKSLTNDGIDVSKTNISPFGLRAENKVHLAKTKAYTAGLIEIQDEGSQLIALLCGAQPGMQVLDACAGGAGKTLALAAQMKNKGRIVAMDTNTRRLGNGKQRIVRAGIHNVEIRPLDDEKHRKWLRRQKETFDVVLVDAPCSSSGTWRRNPDSRWRGHGQEVDEIVKLQTEILGRVEKCVKKGGKLVYATCSLFPEENENQVNAFLSSHPDFEIVPIDQAWKEAGFSGGSPAKGKMMRLSPLQSGTDGFFAAVMRRKGTPAPKHVDNNED